MAHTVANQERVDTILAVLRDVYAEFKSSSKAGSGINGVAEMKKAFGRAVRSQVADIGPKASCCDIHDPVTATVFEFALSLGDPLTEFERDLLKVAVKARTEAVFMLIFVTDDAGLAKTLASPLRREFAEYVTQTTGVEVKVASLESDSVVSLADTVDRKKRQFGLYQGRISIHDDFDELPEEFMSHFR